MILEGPLNQIMKQCHDFSILMTRNTWLLLGSSDYSGICCGADFQPDTVAEPELSGV